MLDTTPPTKAQAKVLASLGAEGRWVWDHTYPIWRRLGWKGLVVMGPIARGGCYRFITPTPAGLEAARAAQAAA